MFELRWLDARSRAARGAKRFVLLGPHARMVDKHQSKYILVFGRYPGGSQSVLTPFRDCSLIRGTVILGIRVKIGAFCTVQW